MKKIHHDFINGEGRLPEGFSEKYNRTAQGYIFHETPFKEYLDEIWTTIDALNDRTGISDWVYFDGRIEINAAIEMITDWVRRHRKMKRSNILNIPITMMKHMLIGGLKIPLQEKILGKIIAGCLYHS